jgi:hypothetical protein
VATIQITDQLGLSVDAQLAPASLLIRYAAGIPKLVLSGESLSHLQGLTLADPAVRALNPGLAFDQPVALGAGLGLTLSASAGVPFAIIPPQSSGAALFNPDDYGDNVPIPADTCYVALGLDIGAGVGAQAASGALKFGIETSGDLSVKSYRPFPAGAAAPTIFEALCESVGSLVIPVDSADLEALAPGVVVTAGGRGNLTFSGSANLLAITNPLATLALPQGAPIPALSVTQAATVSIGASWQISAEYQVRSQKVDSRRVRLGWYRKHGSDFAVTASASAGISAGTSNTDLFPALIGAISADAKAGAGLPPEQAAAAGAAVKAAVNRKLELALTAEFGALGSDEAAFLYEIDLAAWDDAAKVAVDRALKGDLSDLAGVQTLPQGITALRDTWSRASATRLGLRINLLGIFNYGSVSRLALEGTVTYVPSTGELVIVDRASASQIESSAVNFGPDEDKLRRLLAESFLITAAYRGSKTAIAGPELSSSQIFFQTESDAGGGDVLRFAAIARALGIPTPGIPDGISAFGRTSISAEASYDDALARALFLGSDGAPRAHTEYEEAGRHALRLLVLPDGDDSFRLQPATDDALWDRMKDLGPANFRQLLPMPQADGVLPDYLAIQWWADSMCGAAEILDGIDRLSASEPPPPADDPKFQKLRQQLAAHLRDATGKAREQFGLPWGLAAMFLVSGAKARTSVEIVSPAFVYKCENRELEMGASG